MTSKYVHVGDLEDYVNEALTLESRAALGVNLQVSVKEFAEVEASLIEETDSPEETDSLDEEGFPTGPGD